MRPFSAVSHTALSGAAALVLSALLPQAAQAFSASFSWAGIPACSQTSPAFRIAAAPKGTTQLRFNMVDLDAPDFRHGGSTVAYSGGAVAKGAISYTGPCPPQGPQHRYRWTVEALDSAGKVLGTTTTTQGFSAR